MLLLLLELLQLRLLLTEECELLVLLRGRTCGETGCRRWRLLQSAPHLWIHRVHALLRLLRLLRRLLLRVRWSLLLCLLQRGAGCSRWIAVHAAVCVASLVPFPLPTAAWFESAQRTGGVSAAHSSRQHRTPRPSLRAGHSAGSTLAAQVRRTSGTTARGTRTQRARRTHTRRWKGAVRGLLPRLRNDRTKRKEQRTTRRTELGIGHKDNTNWGVAVLLSGRVMTKSKLKVCERALTIYQCFVDSVGVLWLFINSLVFVCRFLL